MSDASERGSGCENGLVPYAAVLHYFNPQCADSGACSIQLVISGSFRGYATKILGDSNIKRYALTSWDHASPEARKAYYAEESFDAYFAQSPMKVAPRLR